MAVHLSCNRAVTLNVAAKPKTKEMKKLMFIVGILVTNISLGADNLPLKNEITDKLILDLSEVELDQNHQDFVVVSFYICDGKIEITEITGTHKQLLQKVKRKLSLLQIEEEYDEETLYRYKLTFEMK